ncbi:alpha/beta fold hydrolase [Nocardia sp. NPDC006630]|uniref:lipase family alpha/beta hydrolase n=1 Tax=Nocardia sp. NPDC006630 TaxID=3157181 RepID=UPI0033AB747D
MPAHIRARSAGPGRGVVKRLAVVVALAAVAVAGVPATAPAAPHYPVPYGLGAALAHFGDSSSPAGANDWNCRPSAEHPEPVILLHGLTATQAENWTTLAPLLANNGYCVFSLTYGRSPALPPPLNGVPGVRSMIDSATEELAPFVDRVLAATGAAKVDFVGHSEGTVMPRWYIKFLGGADKVAKSVNLAPINNGTQANGSGLLAGGLGAVGLWGQAQRLAEGSGAPITVELTTGSDYLNAVNSGVAYAPGIDYTFLMTRYDEAVVPYTSGYGPVAPNITNIVVQDQCPLAIFEHNGAAFDPVAAQDVLNALDPANPLPVDCSGLPRNS